MNEKIARFLAEEHPPTPCLVVDLEQIEANYRALAQLFPQAHIYYAVKANPAPRILNLLAGIGSYFDTASINEIAACIEAGASPSSLSFGNTVKKAADIAAAYDMGVRLYAFDSEVEMEKLAREAPGAQVFCRILVDNEGAGWPLSRKFGCEVEMARDLLLAAGERGLDPYGVSFHVGSQQTNIDKWDIAIARTAMLFSDLSEAGLELRMINIGGGFPADYRTASPPLSAYGEAVALSLSRHFGNRLPHLIIEPGRCVTANAGVIQSEVVLVSRKSYEDARRWVYLDIGKFGGLAETIDESIRYRIRTPHDGGETGPVVLAGPTCDGADVLYETADYHLPLALETGDRIEILGAGAYTTTYASVGFNGFPPLRAHYI